MPMPNAQHPAIDAFQTLGLDELRKRPGIPSCATNPVATDAAVVPESHLPAASAGA